MKKDISGHDNLKKDNFANGQSEKGQLRKV